jgi:hypothetical protein
LCQRKGLKKEENLLPGGQAQLKLFYPQLHAQKESYKGVVPTFSFTALSERVTCSGLTLVLVGIPNICKVKLGF